MFLRKPILPILCVYFQYVQKHTFCGGGQANKYAQGKCQYYVTCWSRFIFGEHDL